MTALLYVVGLAVATLGGLALVLAPSDAAAACGLAGLALMAVGREP